ncbi:MAG: high-potential iron-sulfur protein, partial [Burkholderiaceae bacterium]
MITSNRRTFMFQVAAAGAGALATGHTLAQTKLEENDPQAVALGYKHDSTKVDKAKYPKHEATQKCNNCQLFQGKPAD